MAEDEMKVSLDSFHNSDCFSSLSLKPPQLYRLVRTHFNTLFEKRWVSAHHGLDPLSDLEVKEYKGLKVCDPPKCSVIGGKMTRLGALLVVVSDYDNDMVATETVEVLIPIAEGEEPVLKSVLAILRDTSPGVLAHSDKEVLRNAVNTYPKLEYYNYDSDEDYNDEMLCAPALRWPPPTTSHTPRQTRLTPDGSR